MIRSPISISVVFLLIFFYSCRDDEFDKFSRPEWLAGKAYTQIKEQPELSTFSRCLELTGYDTIINRSGNYTVFAPSNDAFNAWFAGNPAYNSIDDISKPELEKLVKYHIVQNVWSKNQLRSLDIYGWIDTLDINNNQPKGFKRQTLLLERNRKFGVVSKNNRHQIVDTLDAERYRRAITNSRKFVPIFFSEYFDIYDLSSSDYEFYFNRPYGGSNDIHYASARIVSDEIFAENGFIYILDQVVEPLKNAYQFLEEENFDNSYSRFLDLINIFSQFNYNQQRTLQQPGADLGLEVDSLFDLTFPQLAFNLTAETTQPPRGLSGLPSNVTIRYHHGLLAPTDEAFEELENNYIKVPGGWGNLEGAPLHIKRIIANSYLSVNAIYPKDFGKGFYNSESDLVTLDEANIIEKEFGSNSTLAGINKAIVPRAFSSVTGPIYLQQGYSKVMYAIDESGLLPALKRRDEDYMFFVESDRNTSIDSSLIYERNQQNKMVFSAFQVDKGGEYTKYGLNKNDLRTLLLNHIAIWQSNGIARKEFIPNLAGNFILVNNETGEVSGTGPTTVGFRGSERAPNFPTELSANTDNGTTYQIQNWFSFSNPTLFSKISSDFPKFHSLMKKAGLTIDKEYRYNFISNNDSYTVFVPSDAAIDSANISSLPDDELRKVLLTHFVQGDIIFTDGKKEAGYYETARLDEKSTPFSKVYTQLYINPDINVIRLRNKDGEDYVLIIESDLTNHLAGVNMGEGDEVFGSLITNAVIHEIDKALITEELDTN